MGDAVLPAASDTPTYRLLLALASLARWEAETRVPLAARSPAPLIVKAILDTPADGAGGTLIAAAAGLMDLARDEWRDYASFRAAFEALTGTAAAIQTAVLLWSHWPRSPRELREGREHLAALVLGAERPALAVAGR